MRFKGLTLIELLVVIAIISALAGLVFAGAQMTRERGRQTVCMSNLRQLGQAFLMYAQDNEGFLPPYRNWPIQAWGDGVTPPELPWLKGCGWGGERGTFYAPYSLFASIDPYLRSRDVWFCPSDPYAGTETFYWCIFHKYTSYHFTISRKMRDTGYYGKRFIPPSSCQLALDPKYKLDEYACVGLESEPEYYFECAKKWLVPGGNHFEGVNTLYLDGHVKWLKIIHELGGALAED